MFCIEHFSENLYEPVNPPPLHESGSAVLNSHKDKVETGSLDGFSRLIEIPPEIEVLVLL